MEEIHNVLILGAGPAGLTAALYCSRYKLSNIVIGKEIGGTINLSPILENWPGFVGKGVELMNKVQEQLKSLGTNFIQTEIKSIEKLEKEFKVITEKGEFLGKTIIFCLGSEHKKLDIKGEKEFLGKGISYCSTCDGPLFKNKIVSVIGGANSAAISALYLSEIAKKVYIFYRRDKLRCEPVIFDKIKEKNNIEIIYLAKPLEFLGDKKLRKIKVLIDKEEKEIETEGVFIEIGATPSTKILENLGIELDCDGYIKTNKAMETNLEGFFAAGDCTNNTFKQAIVAAGEGAIAANSAFEYLNKKISE